MSAKTMSDKAILGEIELFYAESRYLMGRRLKIDWTKRISQIVCNKKIPSEEISFFFMRVLS